MAAFILLFDPPKLQKKSAAVRNVKTSKVKKIKNEDLVDDTKRDPLRIFYESLYEKVPTSEMAATWPMKV
ncbi:hypothetical protein ABZP36_012796 [Zizania latifolia]